MMHELVSEIYMPASRCLLPVDVVALCLQYADIVRVGHRSVQFWIGVSASGRQFGAPSQRRCP